MLNWRNRYLYLLILCAGLTLLCGFALALLLESGAAPATIRRLGLVAFGCAGLSGVAGILWVISLWRQMRSR
jgi:hypothetical protein